MIDGIGFQAHMLGGKDQQPSVTDMASNLQRFAGLAYKCCEPGPRLGAFAWLAAPAVEARGA